LDSAILSEVVIRLLEVHVKDPIRLVRIGERDGELENDDHEHPRSSCPAAFGGRTGRMRAGCAFAFWLTTIFTNGTSPLGGKLGTVHVTRSVSRVNQIPWQPPSIRIDFHA